jgi:thioredoxin reductase
VVARSQGRGREPPKSGVNKREVVVVGAGPQGLAVAAHLRHAGVDTHVFGEAMGFWKRYMPKGMYLRSTSRASSISDPTRAFSLSRFEAAYRRKMPVPIPIRDFIEYGMWFQRGMVGDLDSRRISSIQRGHAGFRLVADDGELIEARRVVVAAGIDRFAARPPQFASVPESLVSHTFEHTDFSRFAGQRVIVIGGGQSALESAALLHESNADVQVLIRANRLRWLNELQADTARGYRRGIHRIFFPPTGVGPPGLNWIVALPGLYESLPKTLRTYVSHRAIPPAGAAWLRARLKDVPITLEREVSRVVPTPNRLRMVLDDGTETVADHVVLGCGYSVSISRYEFLPSALLRDVRCVDGYPVLASGFESSVPGLYFVGAAAANSFGPVMRFVVGGAFAAREVTRHITGEPPALIDHAW